MKLRIAAGALGLGALLLVPATHAFGDLTPRQQALCAAASANKAAFESALAALPPDAPARARNRIQAKVTLFTNFLNAHPECP
jgi:hypothetical protein